MCPRRSCTIASPARERTVTQPSCIVLLSALAMFGVACSSRSSASPDATPTESTPAPTTASLDPEKPVHETRPDIAVPGYEVVVVDAMDGGPPHGELRAGDAVSTGKDAFLAALGAVGDADAVTLARLAAVFVDPAGAGRSPWLEGDPVIGSDSRPSSPSRSGDTLVYFRAHRQLAEMVRVQVDLRTGGVSVGAAGGPTIVSNSGSPAPTSVPIASPPSR